MYEIIVIIAIQMLIRCIICSTIQAIYNTRSLLKKLFRIDPLGNYYLVRNVNKVIQTHEHLPPQLPSTKTRELGTGVRYSSGAGGNQWQSIGFLLG
jgi:hypothetical protein